MEHYCAFIGHQEIDLARLEYAKNEIWQETLETIAEGYSHFLCGMAQGAALIFSSVVVEIRHVAPVKAIPAPCARKNNMKSCYGRTNSALT